MWILNFQLGSMYRRFHRKICVDAENFKCNILSVPLMNFILKRECSNTVCIATWGLFHETGPLNNVKKLQVHLLCQELVAVCRRMLRQWPPLFQEGGRFRRRFQSFMHKQGLLVNKSYYKGAFEYHIRVVFPWLFILWQTGLRWDF